MRRNAIALAVATALTVTTVPSAHAATANQPSNKVSAQSGTNGESSKGSSDAKGSRDSESSSKLGSSKTGNETWDNMHPILKAIVGVLGATAIVTAFGMLRTIFFNLFHV